LYGDYYNDLIENNRYYFYIIYFYCNLYFNYYY